MKGEWVDPEVHTVVKSWKAGRSNKRRKKIKPGEVREKDTLPEKILKQGSLRNRKEKAATARRGSRRAEGIKRRGREKSQFS